MTGLNNLGQPIDPDTVIQLLRRLARSDLRVPVLDLSSVKLTRIPPEIAEINGLEELYLDENGLTALPDEIGAISELRVLSLGRNLFTSLPTTIVRRWATLQKLFLGHNEISHLPFSEEDLWALSHGSIGRNPIAEPIGRNWMVRKDVEEISTIMCGLIPENLASHIAELFARQFIEIVVGAAEPMIYELLFDGMRVLKDGEILWNTHFDRPWLQSIAVELLESIPRGTIIHPSLQINPPSQEVRDSLPRIGSE